MRRLCWASRMLFHLLQLAAQVGDALAHQAAIRFQLGLARALHADAHAARLAGKMGPGVGEPGQHVFELRHLHLHLGLRRPGVLGEDVQDDAAAVQDLAGDLAFQLLHLRAGEVLVEDHQVGLVPFDHVGDLAHLALAHQGGGVQRGAALHGGLHHLGARRVGQAAQLGQVLLEDLDRQVERSHAHQHGLLPGLRGGLHSHSMVPGGLWVMS